MHFKISFQQVLSQYFYNANSYLKKLLCHVFVATKL